jgi:hypothetical protein
MKRLRVTCIGLMLAIIGPHVAHAASIAEKCGALARFARVSARMRDDGVRVTALEDQTKSALAGEAIEPLAMNILVLVYGHREMTPDALAAATLQGCLQGSE